MKGTFFSKPIEWNIETIGESWQQGEFIRGILRVKNHGLNDNELSNSGVALSYAEIKKVQSRSEGALKIEQELTFPTARLAAGEEAQVEFSFQIDSNAPITDKKGSYYLTFGKDFKEEILQVKVEPKGLFTKVSKLLDTFHRFKFKEFKASKKGVEFKFIPPTSREMANLDTLLLTFSMDKDSLIMSFDFHVKKLNTSSVVTKINKESVNIQKILSPKEYSLGKDLINQDEILKAIDSAISEVKMKNVF